MDKPNVQVFSRSGSPHDQGPTSPKGTMPLSWRKVTLLATPLLLGTINLVSAHFEKRSMIDAASIKYAVLVRDGEQIKRGKINEAKVAGPIEMNAVIVAARRRAQGMVGGAASDADARRQEGKTLGALPQGQRDATFAGMALERELAKNMLEAFRLGARSLGVRIAVSAKIRESVFVEFYPSNRSLSESQQIGEGLLNCKNEVRRIAMFDGNNRIHSSLLRHSPGRDKPCSSGVRVQ